MNDDLLVTAYVVIDETMAALGHRSQRLAQVRDAEVLTVAVVAAKYCANNHERALGVRHGRRYLTQPLSASRYNRRLHALGGWLGLIPSCVVSLQPMVDRERPDECWSGVPIAG